MPKKNIRALCYRLYTYIVGLRYTEVNVLNK